MQCLPNFTAKKFLTFGMVLGVTFFGEKGRSSLTFFLGWVREEGEGSNHNLTRTRIDVADTSTTGLIILLWPTMPICLERSSSNVPECCRHDDLTPICGTARMALLCIFIPLRHPE